MGEVADLFATLGLKVDGGSWAKGDAAIAKTRAALDGAFRDDNGRWRAASGRFLSMGEKAAGAAAGIRGMGEAAKVAGDKADEAGKKGARSFDAAGAAIKGYLLMITTQFGYDKLIKFNETMETSIIGLSAMIEGNLGGSFQEAKVQAQGLYQEFQKFSTQTPAQTADILQFGKAVAVATFQAGGKLKDLQDIAEQGVIASSVLTPERGPAYASLELSEMLMGNVSNRMAFAKQLLGFVKMTEEQFRELNAKQRLEVVKTALNSQAMKDAAGAFQVSFVGRLSTMWDKINITFGKIGVPLFEKLSKAIGDFNGWLDRNGAKIEAVGKAIGEWLGEAFDFVAGAIGFVIDKGTELLAWLGKYIDTGELVKSLMIALGALMVAFGIESTIAWIAATWPILLVVAAVTAVVYAIRKLMAYPGGVRKAFSDAFDAIATAAGEVWDALKQGFSDAFDWIADLPIVKQLIAVVNAVRAIGNLGVGEHERMLQDSGSMSPEDFRKKYPQLPAPVTGPNDWIAPSRTGGTPNVTFGQISVGDIHVSSPNADPVAVADEVRKTFHAELGNVLRQTMDQVA